MSLISHQSKLIMNLHICVRERGARLRPIYVTVYVHVCPPWGLHGRNSVCRLITSIDVCLCEFPIELQSISVMSERSLDQTGQVRHRQITATVPVANGALPL